MKKYSIGQMSKLHKLSIDTLRYYDKIGLFKPKLVNEETKYRYYTADQFLKLERIKYLRRLNFSIDEIKEVIDYSNIDLIQKRLKEGQVRLEKELAEMQLMKARLDSTIESYSFLSNKDNYNRLRIVEYPERYYIARELKDAMDQDEVEVGLRELMEYIGEEKGLYDSLCAFFVEDLDYEQEGYINHDKVAFVADKRIRDEIKTIEWSLLPRGTYASLLYEDDYRNNYIYYRSIVKQLGELGYSLCGEVFEILHVDDSFGKKNSSIIEIQMRVMKR